MSLSKPLIKFFLELYEKKFFKNLDSVMDMGDQDLAGDLSFIKSVFLKNNIEINEEDFVRSKSYPDRPRTSTSTFCVPAILPDYVKRDDDKRVSRFNTGPLFFDRFCTWCIEDLPLVNRGIWGIGPCAG